LVLAQRATKQASRPKKTQRSGRRTPPAKRRSKTGANGARHWSGRVTRESDALDLEGGVFTLDDPKRIAACDLSPFFHPPMGKVLASLQ
jgi:hypothetical protein